MNRLRTLCFWSVAWLFFCGAATAQHFAKPQKVDWSEDAMTYSAAQIDAGPAAASATAQAVTAIPGQGRQGYLISKVTDIESSPNAAYTMGFDIRLGEGPASRAPLLRIEALHVDGEDRNVYHWAFITPALVSEPGAFHEHVISFSRPPRGKIGFRIYWFGYREVSIRGVKVEKKSLPTEQEQLAALKDFKPPDPLPAVDHSKPRILAVLGPYHWTYHIPNWLPGDVDSTYGPASPYAHTRAFPVTYEDLWHYDIVVVSDVGAETFGVKGRKMLLDFVRQGGGLIYLGGMNAYGKAHLQGTFLEELLPVEVGGCFDVKKLEPAQPLSQVSHKALDGVRWQDERIMYVHQVEPKPGTRVVLRAGEEPVLVLGMAGRGKVAAFCGTPFGVPPEGTVAFWDSENWKQTLAALCSWIRGDGR